MRDPHSLFWEIHSGLPREGPGDDASTRAALALVRSLPRHPRILDIGCGPGMQTLALAAASGGTVAAVDTHFPFLAELARRAAAAGLSERIAPVAASMQALPFGDGGFDLVWSEGAIYFMGFREGLAAWRRLLAPGGAIAVSEPCWLTDDIPGPVRALFADYAAMTTIAACRRIVAECGYALLGDFVLPDAAWREGYYDPMERRLAALRSAHAGDAAALATIAEHQREIDIRRQHPHVYGYAFFVMQRAG